MFLSSARPSYCTLFASIAAATAIATSNAGVLRAGPGQTYSTIQAAINAASNGDEVLVEPYTYAEALNLGGKAITLRGRTGQLNTYVIAPATGVSVVSCISGEGTSTVIDGFTFMNSNGAPGIRITGSSPVFRNCTVQNCQISGADGAALLVTGTNPNPRLESCYFQGNRTTSGNGGAAAIKSGLTTLTGCIFQSNEVSGGGNAQLGGGAIYCDTGRINATNVAFTSNAVRTSACNSGDLRSFGGALFIVNAACSFSNCSFSANLAQSYKDCGATSWALGGTVYESVSSSSYQGCTFTDSLAQAIGNNGKQARGGAMYFAAGADPTISNCTFTNPRTNGEASGYGGFAFYEGGCLGTISNTTVTGAYATNYGGAVYVQNSAAPLVTDCRFNTCTTGTEGGAWYVEPLGAGSPSPMVLRTTFNTCSSPNGGAIMIRENSQLVIDGCRFTQCTATSQGGAIFVYYAPITVRNTSFDRNTSPNGSAVRTTGDTNRYPYIGGSFFCGNSGAQGNWILGTWFDAPPGNTNQFAVQCSTDCNNNGAFDDAEIASGAVPDCNHNGVPDSCDIAAGTAADCDGDGRLNSCEIASQEATDCNSNGVPDNCEPDCDSDGIPNQCEIAAGAPDCNLNGVPDACDIAAGTTTDRNKDGIPDTCQHLEYLGLRSEYVPVAGTANDPTISSTAVCVRVYAEFSNAGANLAAIYGNPAHPLALTVSGGGFFQSAFGGNTSAEVSCTPEVAPPSLAYDSWLTINRTCDTANELQVVGFDFTQFNTANGFTDNDCIVYVTPGQAQSYAGPTKRVLVAQLTTRTGAFPTFRFNAVGRNADGSDWVAYEQVAPLPTLVDCNSNGVHDVLDVATGGAYDCNDNGLPDACEFPNFNQDCNDNGIPDRCDIFAGTSQDVDGTGVPDECECIGDINRDGLVNVDDIVAVIMAWGDVGSSPADVNGDGSVNGGDLGLVLAGYGGCP